jgi:hypothetical protein
VDHGRPGTGGGPSAPRRRGGHRGRRGDRVPRRSLPYGAPPGLSGT